MPDLAVVCGATGGLGTAVVEAFVERGDHVIAVARSRADITRLQSLYPSGQIPSPSGGGQGGGFVTGDTADLTQRTAVDDLWERIDRVGVPRWLVNTVGGYRAKTVAETTPDDFSFMLDLNLGSAWWSCRAASRRMGLPPSADGKQSGAQRGIVNVSSRSGLAPDGGAAAYAIAKAGVIKLTEVLASELKNSGVRVNCVVPAVMNTEANRRSLPEKLLQRAVSPGEVAAVIAYLCSAAAEGVTGAVLPVYGPF